MHETFPSFAPPIVELRRVTRRFGNKTALDDLSLAMPRGGPVAVVFGLIVGLGIWLIASRGAQALLDGLVAGGALLSVVAMIGGMIMGNCGPDDANFEMGNFLATRPLTNVDLARTVLKSAVKSVFLAWLIWAAAFVTLHLTLLALRISPPALPKGLSWWYFPTTLIGAWTVLSLLTSAGLTGRSRLLVKLFCALFALCLALTLFSNFALSLQAQQQFRDGASSVCGVLFVLATAWAMLAARRRAMIGWSTAYFAASIWAALSAMAAVVDVWHLSQRPAFYMFLVGVCALALAPLATAPLALAWNRNR